MPHGLGKHYSKSHKAEDSHEPHSKKCAKSKHYWNTTPWKVLLMHVYHLVIVPAHPRILDPQSPRQAAQVVENNLEANSCSGSTQNSRDK